MQPTERMESLLSKLQNLPAERIGEVEDFVDFLNMRMKSGVSSRDALRISAPSLAKVWDNADDADYDRM